MNNEQVERNNINFYSFAESILVGCLCRGSDLYVFDKALFEDSLTVPFENITVKI